MSRRQCKEGDCWEHSTLTKWTPADTQTLTLLCGSHAVAYLHLSDNFSQTKHTQYRVDRNESGTAADGIHDISVVQSWTSFPSKAKSVMSRCVHVCARYTVGGVILQTKAMIRRSSWSLCIYMKICNAATQTINYKYTKIHIMCQLVTILS